MDRAVLREAARLSELHHPYALALLVDAEGSTPRGQGASMLAREDGTLLGTVGGAALEERVKELLATALREHRGSLRTFELRGWKKGAVPSRCGGSVTIAVRYVEGGPNVLIWGAGHTGMALSRVLTAVGYDHTVADDRPGFALPERFPGAHACWSLDHSELAPRLLQSAERFSHAYLLGYDAEKDEDLLASLLPAFPGHVGLIASRTKRGLTLRSLARRGLSKVALQRLRSPVGIEIGAETPEEIAVSITAEVIRDVRGAA